MKVIETKLAGLKLIVPDVHQDERGYFKELYSQRRYDEAGMPGPFVQDNLSVSKKGVLRGMHYDLRMAKLVQVLSGRVFDVAVDMREGSPTYRQWDGAELSAENHYQFYLPPGFAHGFLVLSDRAIVTYKQTALYDPAQERAIAWNDPHVGIEWPLNGAAPVLSAKDAAL